MCEHGIEIIEHVIKSMCEKIEQMRATSKPSSCTELQISVNHAILKISKISVNHYRR